MNQGNKARLAARINGRVQGVGFRFFVRENASRLDLRGWVRNRKDRSVEVTAEGETSDLEQLLRALEQGPRGAQVDEVTYQWETATGEYNSFKIKLSF